MPENIFCVCGSTDKLGMSFPTWLALPEPCYLALLQMESLPPSMVSGHSEPSFSTLRRVVTSNSQPPYFPSLRDPFNFFPFRPGQDARNRMTPCDVRYTIGRANNFYSDCVRKHGSLPLGGSWKSTTPRQHRLPMKMLVSPPTQSTSSGVQETMDAPAAPPPRKRTTPCRRTSVDRALFLAARHGLWTHQPFLLPQIRNRATSLQRHIPQNLLDYSCQIALYKL